MDVFVVIALVAVALLLAELLLPTGGALAAVGALGLVGAGVVALTADAESSASDWAGPGLITLGVLSLATSYFVGRKVLEAHRDEPVPPAGVWRLIDRSATTPGTWWWAQPADDAARAWAARHPGRIVQSCLDVPGLRLVPPGYKPRPKGGRS